MNNDSELENLQCYPFHLPESGSLVFRPIAESDPVEVLRVSPEGEILAIADEYTWGTGRDAQIVKDLLEMAGIPVDEEGSNDNATMGI